MDLWVFDNDNTLYDSSIVYKKSMELFFQYISKLLGIPISLLSAETARLKQKWHTEFSIIAFMKEYGIDFEETVYNTYLKINLEECSIVAPDIERLEILQSINSPKVVFTNNPSIFARRVLSYTGLIGCFLDFIGMEEIGFCDKSDPYAYRIIEEHYKGFQRIIFCDDFLKNLETAHKLGWTTIWYKPSSSSVEAQQNHIIVSSFKELKNFV